MEKHQRLQTPNSSTAFYGVNVHFVEEFDFSLPDTIEQKFKDVMVNILHGKIHHLFLCHHHNVNRNITNCDLPEFDKSLLINVRSNVHLMSLAFPFLKQNARET